MIWRDSSLLDRFETVKLPLRITTSRERRQDELENNRCSRYICIICMEIQKYEEGKSVSFQDKDEKLTHSMAASAERELSDAGMSGREDDDKVE